MDFDSAQTKSEVTSKWWFYKKGVISTLVLLLIIIPMILAADEWEIIIPVIILFVGILLLICYFILITAYHTFGKYGCLITLGVIVLTFVFGGNIIVSKLEQAFWFLKDIL